MQTLPGSTATVVTNVMTGGVLVDTVQIRSNEFFLMRVDTFTGQFAMGPMAMPEPGTLALFVTGLIGLGLLSRRRRKPMA